MMPSSALVVDDEPAIRRLLTRLLERSGWRVTMASGGAEALGALEEAVFDVILLDISMPEMSGLSVLAAIRGRPEWRRHRVVACTAHAYAGYADELRAAGFDGVLVKPFTRDQLDRTLESREAPAAPAG